MFAEPSPAGAKYAASLLGLCTEECPFTVMPLSDATKQQRIRQGMEQTGTYLISKKNLAMQIEDLLKKYDGFVLIWMAP